MAEVIIDEQTDFQRALKIFKRKVQKAGILKDLRQKRHYEKPSAQRKKKAEAAERRRRKNGRG